MTIAALGVSATMTGVIESSQGLDKLTGSAERAETATEKLSPSSKRAGDDIKRLGADAKTTEGSLARLATRALAVGAALLGAFGIGALGRVADGWAELQARAVNAVGSMEGGIAVMGRLEQMARNTYSSLESTAESWLSNATNLSAMGVSIEKQLDLVQSLNDAMVISATRGQRADSVMRGWSNAMTLGTLRGNDLNAVLTGSDRLAQALATSMGVSVLELRRLGSEGKITREQLLGVTSQMEKLAREAADMPATLADARQIWSNTMLAIVGLIDQALGASEGLASSMIGLADAVRAGAQTLVTLATIVSSSLSPAFDWLGNQLENLSGVAGVAVAALAGFYAPAVLAGLSAVSFAIGTTMVGAVRALTVAMLANPLGLFIAGISGAVAAAFIFRDEIKQTIGVDVVEVFESGANTVIGAMVGAYRAIQASWDLLPAYFGDIGARAWNAFLAAFEGPAVTWTIPGTDTTIDLINLDLTDFKRPTSNVSASVENVARQAFASAQGYNYVGSIATALGEAWTNAEGATQSLEELMATLDGAGARGAGSGSGAGSKSLSAYQEAIKYAHDFIAAQELEALALGMTEQEANRLRYTQDLLNRAQQNGQTITEAQALELYGLGAAMAAAEERTRLLTQAANDNAAMWKAAEDGVSGVLKSWARGGDVLDTITSKLGQIGDMLIDMAVRNLFQNAFGGGAGIGGGGGGLLGGFLIPGILHQGGIAGLHGYDHGRIFPGSTWASAERYHNGGIAGLRPNEVPAILERGERIIPANWNGGPANQNVKVELTVKVDGARGNAEIEQAVKTGVAQGLKAVEKNIGNLMADYQMRFT